MTTKCNQTWDTCSPEVLISILKYTNYETLLKCMIVNKFWYEIAVYTGFKYGQWEKFTDDKMTNNGISFKQRTKLNFRDIYKNSLLWFTIDSAEKKLYHTYDVDNIKKINVYQNNLIVVTKDNVKYFEIETCKELRVIETSCMDYDETNYIILKAQRNENSHITLMLKGKISSTEFDDHKDGILVFNDIVHYKLENDRCVTIDARNAISNHRWDYKSWKTNFLATYYCGSSREIEALSIYNRTVHVLTQPGVVYKTTSLLNLEKVFDVNIDFCHEHYFEILLTAYYKGLEISNKDSDEARSSDARPMDCAGSDGIKTSKSGTDVAVHLECCAADLLRTIDMHPILIFCHGDCAIMDYGAGMVDIRVFDRKNSLKRNIIMELSVHSTKPIRRIISLNVYEEKNCHHVFMATTKNILQVKFTHLNQT